MKQEPAIVVHSVPSNADLKQSSSRRVSIALEDNSPANTSGTETKDIYTVNYPPAKQQTRQNYIRTTKYTLLTFLPLNLYHQFKRAYNIYFLLACFSVIGGYSSVSATSMIGPLLIVLAFSAAKEALEDFNRYRADKAANTSPCVVVKNNKKLIIECQNLMPGDILYVEKGGKFPVDCILISSSYEEGTVFVETAELDGYVFLIKSETNLKRRSTVNQLNELNTEERVCEIKGAIKCDPPNENLSSFQGVVEAKSSIVDGTFPVSMRNMALRGCVLRNTEWTYALVVFTGSNTKIIKNLKQSIVKTSTLEHGLNWTVILAFIFNMIVLAVSVILQYFRYSTAVTIENTNKANNVTDYSYQWYLGPVRSSYSTEFIATFLSFFAVYTYIIPISLFVSIELVRLGQATQMALDPKMAYKRENNGVSQVVPMRASNSSLNEDLGRVEYIFSDKTGTFTQNEMRMARWFIQNQSLDEMAENGALARAMESADEEDLRVMNLFGRALSLCHGVIPSFNEKANELIYESQSPDETALLIGARNNGFELLKRNKSEMTVLISDQEETFKILNVIEFDSTRKRMSIIVETPEGIHLYCKGADNIMFERMKEGENDEMIENAKNALIEYSDIGLRTLVIGYKSLSDEEYETFRLAWEDAEIQLHGREQKLDEVAATVECDFTFLGCTAIEDRLQDRVPETIDYLLKAGIKLWLLTGDKQETAINIGMSSKLISPQMKLLILNGKSEKECIKNMDEMLKEMNNQGKNKIFALVVNGDVLTNVFSKAKSKVLCPIEEKFLEIASQCRSVICSRVTPLQKALVVKLVKQKYPKSTTLSIGDGANDVSMIQEAHIGVGIMGKEGTQAVRASDYAFGEFRFLQRLLTVHGRYNYLRLSNLIYYSFYKNLVFIMIQFYFNFVNGWSGQLVYEELFFTAFNVIFTSIPPLVYGIYERDIPDTFIEKNPQLYSEVRKGLYWNTKNLFYWFISAMIHSVIIFITVLLLNFEGSVDFDGRSTGYWVQAYLFSTPMLLVVLSKKFVFTRFYNWIVLSEFPISVLLNVIVMFALLILDSFYYTDYATSVIVHGSPAYYILCLLLPAVCIVPELLLQYFSKLLYPSDVDIIHEQMDQKGKIRVVE